MRIVSTPALHLLVNWIFYPSHLSHYISEVRFKDYGLKSIEVIDNGHGISEDDYDHIGEKMSYTATSANIPVIAALKHHTSKLASFEDLSTVLTFGFRGEALSSLCALSSSVTVTSSTAAQTPMGTILDFERSGKVKDKTGRVARKVCPNTDSVPGSLLAHLPVIEEGYDCHDYRVVYTPSCQAKRI